MKQDIIESDNDYLIIKIPLRSERSNPYDPDFHAPMDHIVGVIAGDEIGFASWIDMDYKGKDDQVSTLWYYYHGTRDEFLEVCNKNHISVVEYETCQRCGNPIFGSCTWEDAGFVCHECSIKNNK